MERIIDFLENEYWYPGVVNDGYLFPLGAKDKYTMDFSTNDTFNQVTPIILSSKGRYLYADRGKIEVANGKIVVNAERIDFDEGYATLKGAYHAVKDKYYQVQPAPKAILDIQYQYCTWMALKTNQNQKGILEYAKSIIDYGFPPGLLIIDDSWQKSFGDWRFNERFENPKAMVEQLHTMGFQVSLWIAPYISPRAECFDEVFNAGLLLMNEDGSWFEANSWLGKTAAFDLCNPNTREWLTKVLDDLRLQYGIDGFKFDGGDEAFIRGANTDCVKQNELWCSFYPCDIVECRSAYEMGGAPVIQRLADKAHQWDVKEIFDPSIQDTPFLRYGLASVVPDALLQGLCGYYYTCPDMVGGGLSHTLGMDTLVDEELVVRNCQAEILMPFVQFSFPFWETHPTLHKAFKNTLKIRERVQEYINQLFLNIQSSEEPIMRYMEFEYPNQGFEKVTDQFMLGDRVLVAPVCEQGATQRWVDFPEGEWQSLDGKQSYEGGKFLVSAGLEALPVFIKK